MVAWLRLGHIHDECAAGNKQNTVPKLTNGTIKHENSKKLLLLLPIMPILEMRKLNNKVRSGMKARLCTNDF